MSDTSFVFITLFIITDNLLKCKRFAEKTGADKQFSKEKV